VSEWLEEIVVVQEPGSTTDWPPAEQLAPDRREVILLHRSPRDTGFGGVRKAAFEYALRRGFDFAIVMRDGLHPPQLLPGLVHPVLVDPRRVVVASRVVRRGEPFRAVAHVLATGFLNRILGLRQHDYHSDFRLYPLAALRQIPFQLNADDRAFDMQLVIQCRALGVPIEEASAPPAWREYPTARFGLTHVMRACGTALDYRLHQLHATRRGRYFVDHGVQYALKFSRTGSHMQIVDAIRPGSRVLDLGCSQGLLARPLREKNVRVTGVDARSPEGLADELDEYFQRNLEEPVELPTGRVFDHVLVADVIEHVRNPTQLLRSVRRFLKPEGSLIISTPNIAVWFYRLSLLVGRFEYGPRGVLDETHVHLYTRATFRRQVEKAGFQVLRERVTSLPFEVVFESTGRSRLIRAIASLYHLLARLWPGMFAYQFILEGAITTLDEEATK
jgi:2-polyprenyl-3-methyl-5-hydroxy-6-metoxy-1,4-benzoquinol methylase